MSQVTARPTLNSAEADRATLNNGQSRRDSAIETTTQQVIGYLVAVAFQHWVCRPLLDIPGGFGGSLAITSSFAVLAWIRSYCVRRWFAGRS